MAGSFSSLADALQAMTVSVDVDGPDEPKISDSGVIEIPTDDGGVVVSFGNVKSKKTGFDDNLADKVGGGQLIADQLLQGIDADDKSRAEWLATRERGIDLLGFKLEDPRGDVGSSSSPLEGMATVRHPVLAHAVLQAQATAAGELLPAGGPVKAETIGPETEQTSQEAEALEKDLNDYLTNHAPEYYPETRRALFWSSFGGSSFKKVYNCPIRRRPVSESVDAKDIIISAAATDLTNVSRLTHQIVMRPSVMKRMQLSSIYLDVYLGQPSYEPNQVDEKQAEVEGISVRIDRPEDQPFTVYECYCELDLDEFAPKQFKGKGIPLPYRVTIEKTSRALLEIRRNWNEEDEQCLPRKVFVKYPYVEAMGIYGIGLLHILGNADTALTAAWRIMLDNGMFSNFPGMIVDKAASKQLTNEFRVPPGGAVQLDFGGRPANQVIGPLPYRNLDAAFLQFIGSVQDTVQKLAGAAEMQVGEGRQDAPVGTTIALIEQATKIQSEVHKGLHAAQSEEFKLLKERFREDPEAIFRHNPRSEVMKMLMDREGLKQVEQDDDAAQKKRADLFLAALDSCEIVPVADPNAPSHIHRIMKFQALKQLQMGNPRIDSDEVDRIGIRLLGFDSDALIKPPAPQSQQPDPRLLTAMAAMKKAMNDEAELQFKMQSMGATMQDKAAERATKEKIEGLRLQIEQMIHSADAQNTAQQGQQKITGEIIKAHSQQQHDLTKHREGLLADYVKQKGQQQHDMAKHQSGMMSDHVMQAKDHRHAFILGQQALLGQENDNGDQG